MATAPRALLARDRVSTQFPQRSRGTPAARAFVGMLASGNQTFNHAKTEKSRNRKTLAKQVDTDNLENEWPRAKRPLVVSSIRPKAVCSTPRLSSTTKLRSLTKICYSMHKQGG
jgi:hypothetical protein